MPARVWDGFVERALASVLDQQLPEGIDLEVIVALGAHDDPRPEPPDGVTVIANPAIRIPEALNAALARSTGDVVVRVDSRSVLPPHYVARAVEHLRDDTIGCVGGGQAVLDRGILGSAYAIAFNSPLLGPSAYRYRRTPGLIESPYLGAWRRSDMVAAGPFDTRLRWNEDNEFNDRIRALGKTVFYDPELVVGYRAARSLRGILRHHYEFGRSRSHQDRIGQQGLHPRHRAALAAVAGLGSVALAGLAARRTRRATLAAGGAAYVVAAAAASRSASRMRDAVHGPPIEPFHPAGIALAPALALIVDLGWIAGVVRGRLARSSDAAAPPVHPAADAVSPPPEPARSAV